MPPPKSVMLLCVAHGVPLKCCASSRRANKKKQQPMMCVASTRSSTRCSEREVLNGKICELCKVIIATCSCTAAGIRRRLRTFHSKSPVAIQMKRS